MTLGLALLFYHTKFDIIGVFQLYFCDGDQILEMFFVNLKSFLICARRRHWLALAELFILCGKARLKAASI